MSKKSSDDILVELANKWELFHTPDLVACATITDKGHKETVRIDSDYFKTMLTDSYSEQEENVPSQASIKNAIEVVKAFAIRRGNEYDVFLRIAGDDDVIYINLANKAGQVIKITADEWKVIDDPPIRFLHTDTMKSLPLPDNNGSFDDLAELINFKEENQRILFIAWIVGSCRPKGPYPVLIIQGEGGSAKSTTAQFARVVIDPAQIPLLAMPKNERDIMISAQKNYILAYDNLSGLRKDFSDIFCRISTGIGFTTRKLYTDFEEVTFKSNRSIIFNGIEAIANRSDLADRAIILYTTSFDKSSYQTEEDYWKKFDEAHPKILGGICNALKEILKNKSNVKVEKLPRMADFAKWVIAAESALPWEKGAFMKAYKENRAQTSKINLNYRNPLIETVCKMMSVEKHFIGTASDLMTKFKEHVGKDEFESRRWPKNPQALSRYLKKFTSALKKVGIEYISAGRTSKERFVEIRYLQAESKENDKSMDSQPAPQIGSEDNKDLKDLLIKLIPRIKEESDSSEKPKIKYRDDKVIIFEDGSAETFDPRSDEEGDYNDGSDGSDA